MDPSHQAIIAQAISLLQSLGTPAAKRPSAATVSMPEFEFALSACITNSKTLAP